MRPLVHLFHSAVSRVIVRTWPFSFGHLRLLKWIRAPVPSKVTVTVRLRGFPLHLEFAPTTYIGRILYYRGMYEEQVVCRIAGLLRPGMTFLDVGANIGLHTVIAAYLVGPTGHVVAVEPQKETYERLMRNVRLNELVNVQAFQCAVYSTAGNLPLFHLSEGNDGLATLCLDRGETPIATETVRVITLPDLARAAGIGHVDGLKLDVEGAELEVLRGADGWFSTAPPGFMFVECHDGHLRRFGASSRALIGHLQARNYQVFGLVRGRWKPVGREEDLSADLLAIHKGV